MIVSKPLDLPLLQTELAAASVVVPSLGTTTAPNGATDLHTYDAGGAIIDLPPEAAPVVEAHVAPPLLVAYAGQEDVHAIVRTTDAAPLEVFRFACDQRRVYTASLTITGIDAATFATKVMEGRFAWKRFTTNALLTGITVVSDLHDTAAATWAPNALPAGAAIVFTVAGAAGRTIDWLLVGTVSVYSPAGQL